MARVGLAIVFVFFGGLKFSSHSMYVRIFAQIGFGQWFRYVTGVIEIAGAVAFWLLHRNGFAALVPGALLVATAYIGRADMARG